MVTPVSLASSSMTASRLPATHHRTLTPGWLAFSVVRSAPLPAPHGQSPAPASSLVHAASTFPGIRHECDGEDWEWRRRKPCTTHEIQKIAGVDESRRGSKTGTNQWMRGRHTDLCSNLDGNGARPQQEQAGLSKKQRGEERAEVEADAARQAPAWAPRS